MFVDKKGQQRAYCPKHSHRSDKAGERQGKKQQGKGKSKGEAGPSRVAVTSGGKVAAVSRGKANVFSQPGEEPFANKPNRDILTPHVSPMLAPS